MIPVSIGVFIVSLVVLHVLHARIGTEHPKLLAPAGRVLLEFAPTTVLARRLSQGKVRHRLAGLYRFVWYVHLASGLVFAFAIMISAYVTLS